MIIKIALLTAYSFDHTASHEIYSCMANVYIGIMSSTHKARPLCPIGSWRRISEDLRALYTMDHEVIPRPCKICDRLLNSSRITLVYTKD